MSFPLRDFSFGDDRGSIWELAVGGIRCEVGCLLLVGLLAVVLELGVGEVLSL